MNAAYQIEWTEYERGWGPRPDGKSYHKSKKDADEFITDFYAKEKADNPG